MFDPRILTDDQRRGYMLAHVYERTRKKTQRGYKVFQVLNEHLGETSQLKAFTTVIVWLTGNGWQIKWDEVHWQGYVEFVFKSFEPSVPMPGQLKNGSLLRKYVGSFCREEASTIRSKEEMLAIYKDVLVLDETIFPHLMRDLGLDGD